MEVTYTLKRSRVGNAIEYPNFGAMIQAVGIILRDRKKRGIPGKIWMVVEIKKGE